MKSFILLSLIFITLRVFGQQSEYYQKAAQVCLTAASKTKCPNRAAVLKEYANWNQCMVSLLAGTTSSCPEPPTTPIPDCAGDMIDNNSSSSSSNQIQPNYNPVTDNTFRNSQINNSTANTTQQKNEAITNAGNALIGAAEDIYSTIQASKQRKEDYWNNLTPEERQAVIEANRKADSTKSANKNASDREEVNAVARHKFSIGVYGGIESRDFTANNISEFYNKDNFSKTIPIIFNIKEPTGYNVGLNLEWAADNNIGLGKTRKGLISLGIYYVTYSAPMIINQDYDTAISYNGNVAMLKFQSIRIAPTLSFRLFRVGTPRSLSGIFFQLGLKADYMFSATANPVTFDENAQTTEYSSISTKVNINNHFKKLEGGIILGLRFDLSRHFYINLQYDLLGGVDNKVLKSKYSENNDWYSFKEKHKTTAGIGIYF